MMLRLTRDVCVCAVNECYRFMVATLSNLFCHRRINRWSCLDSISIWHVFYVHLHSVLEIILLITLIT